MAAGEAPALRRWNRGMQRPRPLNQPFKKGVECLTTNQRDDPAFEKQPLPSDCEEGGANQSERHNHTGCSHATNCPRDGLTCGSTVSANPVECGRVEGRDGFVMQDVFSEREKDPQATEAYYQPNGEMEAKVLAARKSRGEERPDAWIALAQLLHRTGLSQALPCLSEVPNECCAMGQEPAAQREQRRDQDAEEEELAYQ